MNTRFPTYVTHDAALFDELRRLNVSPDVLPPLAPVVPPLVGVHGNGNASTLNGFTAYYILNRANHTGPWYTLWDFANEQSGFILRGRANGGLYRLKSLDDDPANPQAGLDLVPTVVTGDILFASALNGPVLVGRYRGGLYRLKVDDEETDNPQLAFEFAGTIASGDFQFGYSGAGFCTRSRELDANGYPAGRRWFWWVNDHDGGDLVNDTLQLEAA